MGGLARIYRGILFARRSRPLKSPTNSTAKPVGHFNSGTRSAHFREKMRPDPISISDTPQWIAESCQEGEYRVAPGGFPPGATRSISILPGHRPRGDRRPRGEVPVGVTAFPSAE